jgi:hypothetical protein
MAWVDEDEGGGRGCVSLGGEEEECERCGREAGEMDRRIYSCRFSPP